MTARIRCLAPLLFATAATLATATEAAPASARVVVPTRQLLADPVAGGLQARLQKAVDQVCAEAARTMVVGRQEYLADCHARALAEALKQAESLGALVARRR